MLKKVSVIILIILVLLSFKTVFAIGTNENVQNIVGNNDIVEVTDRAKR